MSPNNKSKKKPALNSTFQQLFSHAVPYLKRAHSPYSRVQVASAVLMDDGQIYGGCNIENASYGGTICAERVAITKAISEGAEEIVAILVVTNQNEIWPPCGFCRQVISEFATTRTEVYCARLDQKFYKTKFSKLLPGAFGAHFLK